MSQPAWTTSGHASCLTAGRTCRTYEICNGVTGDAAQGDLVGFFLSLIMLTCGIAMGIGDGHVDHDMMLDILPRRRR
ncbi:hypothetical protein BJ508DRAFT_119507 [Ascobolus immersus RN42]|uniref:Uncharacterized protein n=1 Tax=Ascobolus immersus RN42 TaxID=1160509 RepID=A0A3N4IR69_ASCIM|nr:hypothetical protein BJ508DRAFT_119507 [Ascobolus immersus RN42]